MIGVEASEGAAASDDSGGTVKTEDPDDWAGAANRTGPEDGSRVEEDAAVAAASGEDEATADGDTAEFEVSAGCEDAGISCDTASSAGFAASKASCETRSSVDPCCVRGSDSDPGSDCASGADSAGDSGRWAKLGGRRPEAARACADRRR